MALLLPQPFEQQANRFKRQVNPHIRDIGIGMAYQEKLSVKRFVELFLHVAERTYCRTYSPPMHTTKQTWHSPFMHTAKQMWRSVPEVQSTEAITKMASSRGGVASLLNHYTGAQFGGRTDRLVNIRMLH